LEGEKVVGFNYDYCTGCGICSVECPPKEKAIVMVKEEIKLAEGRKK
jgi:Pyruvate/2-oxoacid:ferredoxin oxidoreductase delta subunit